MNRALGKNLLSALALLVPLVVAAVPGTGESRLEIEPLAAEALSDMTCEQGEAGDFHCHGVDLLAYLPLSDMQCGGGNDLWGWTDPVTSSEYALMGCNNGTSFVDVTDPTNPVYIGRLPTHSANSLWRDIKVHDDHAFVVADFAGAHGMQVFDLTRLRTAVPPETFNHDAWYGQIGSAHNIVINEAAGYAYIVGISSGVTTCGGGLHIVNIQQPQSPQFEGCFSTDGYTHDAQCVVYQGPDTNHQGSEICFNANPAQNSPQNTLTIVDVTDPQSPSLISATAYAGSAYAHQGWLTEDHEYFLFGDELDEGNPATQATRTFIWDVRDLSSPQVIGVHQSGEISIDHNQYIKGDFLYQSNYTAGLRILDLSDVAIGELSEVAYFNVIPHDHGEDQGPHHDEVGGSFNGTWSNYPFFDSGIVIVSAMGGGGTPGGLFVLRPRLAAIAGVVTRDDTGEPLEGARIDVSGPGQWHEFSASDGRYIIDTAAGEYQVTASMAGFPDHVQSAVATVAGEQSMVSFALATPPGTLDVSPLAHDFGAIDNDQTALLEVTVTNAVPEPARALDLTDIGVSGDGVFGITATGTCDTQASLAPLESCTIEVNFVPVESGDYQGTVHITTTDEQSVAINLTGTGLPAVPAELVVEPMAVDFGETYVGQDRNASLTVTNAAPGDAMSLILTQLVVVAGTNVFASDSGTCKLGMELAPGQGCTLTIEFSPTTATLYSGVFRVGIEDDHRNIGLAGRGVEALPPIFQDRFEDPAAQAAEMITDTSQSRPDIE
jgi:choice-of-anchor B domain-containing protein